MKRKVGEHVRKRLRFVLIYPAIHLFYQRFCYLRTNWNKVVLQDVFFNRFFVTLTLYPSEFEEHALLKFKLYIYQTTGFVHT